MGIIIDTSVLIAADKRKFDFAAFCMANSDESMSVSAITASELWHGSERASDPKIRAKRRHFTSDVLSQMEILAFGEAEAEHHARIWAALEAQGRRIGPHDLLIAATALNLEFSVATLNQREFGRIPELELIETDLFKLTAPGV
jgi:tRNA(fMet)-specific endonuclease VapC